VTELPFPISTVEEFAWLMKLVALLLVFPPPGGGPPTGVPCPPLMTSSSVSVRSRIIRSSLPANRIPFGCPGATNRGSTVALLTPAVISADILAQSPGVIAVVIGTNRPPVTDPARTRIAPPL
jgi:hypothetical protein